MISKLTPKLANIRHRMVACQEAERTSVDGRRGWSARMSTGNPQSATLEWDWLVLYRTLVVLTAAVTQP